LTSLSFSSPRYQPSLELYTGLSGALPSPYPLTPYDRVNDYHVAHARGLEVVNVMEKLGLGEAQGIMSIWSKKGMVVHRKCAVYLCPCCRVTDFVIYLSATDELFLGKFAESGGNAREFGRGLSTTLAI
jgi:small subunit ribosomal protein S29